MKKSIVFIMLVLPMMVSAQTMTPMDSVQVNSIQVDSTQVDSLSALRDSMMVFEDTMPKRPCIFDSMAYVIVHQDSAVAQLLQDKVGGVVRGQETVAGFRVQIYSSNRQQTAKSEAIELEHRLENALPAKIYTQYISPFWKVRVGDFTTYEEAKAFKEQLIQYFPFLKQDAYIVRDQVNVHP
ncbi:MAG: SPOR domain-containing protein [Paludibacteraceae bacterium]|nr:SPOR domain-containing protein [Paludibacteraceae bacterium]